MAHELTHTVQQGGGVKRKTNLEPGTEEEKKLDSGAVAEQNLSPSPEKDQEKGNLPEDAKEQKKDNSPLQPVETKNFKEETQPEKSEDRLQQTETEDVDQKLTAQENKNSQTAKIQPENSKGEAEEAEVENEKGFQLHAQDTAGLIEQFSTVPPSKSLPVFDQAEQISPGLMEKESSQLQSTMPEINAPTGLPAKSQSKRKSTKKGAKGEVAEVKGKESGSSVNPYSTNVPDAPMMPRHRAVQLRGGAGKPGESDDKELAQSAQSSLDSIGFNSRNISTKAGTLPHVDVSGNADPSQLASFKAGNDAQVKKGKLVAMSETAQDFGENDIYPKKSNEKISSKKRLRSGKFTPGKYEKGADVHVDLKAGIDISIGPQFQSRLGEQNEKYKDGRTEFDEGVDQAKVDSENSIARENSEARKRQLEQQSVAKKEVDGHRQEWHHELNKVEKSYNSKAEKATKDQKEKILTQKKKTESQAKKHLDDAEKKSAQEKTKAEKKAAKEKSKSKKESKGFWGWVKSAASAFIEGLKKAVNFIYDNLRKAVKLIFEAAKFLVQGVIELGRMAIVGLIKLHGEILKGFVTVVFAAFPAISKKINAKIDSAVNRVTEVVNSIAEGLKSVVGGILDFLANTIDSLLGIVQSLYNGIFDVLGMIVRGEFGKLVKKLGYLLSAAKESPDHFETAALEELLGGNLDEPLSGLELMQASGKGLLPKTAKIPASNMALPQKPWEGKVGVDEVPDNMTLSPELSAQLMLMSAGGRPVEFGQSNDQSRTMESVMSELTGQQTAQSDPAEKTKNPDDGLKAKERAKGGMKLAQGTGNFL